MRKKIGCAPYLLNWHIDLEHKMDGLFPKAIIDAGIRIASTFLIDKLKTIFNSTKAFDTGDKSKHPFAEIDILQKTTANQCLLNHFDTIKAWCSTVGFRDLKSTKQLASIYIDLEVHAIPIKNRISKEEYHESLDLALVISKERGHVVILGQPGAGKTTSMKKICKDFLIEKKNIPNHSFPVVIKLRDKKITATSTPIFTTLQSICPLIINWPEDVRKKLKSEQLWEIEYFTYLNYIDALKPIIILDGFDELPDQNSREHLLEEFRSLTNQFRYAKFILTCRSGEFNYSITNTFVFEIAPLSDSKIKLLCSHWLADETRAEKFYLAVKNSPFADTAIKPLLLAHLCAIYERIGEIPNLPKTVYKKVVRLLIEEWDEQQSIKRSSKFNEFSPDQKLDFLEQLAFTLTIENQRSEFDRAELLGVYKRICKNFSLPSAAAIDVLEELESHSGLFIQSGFDKYEFPHKSIQEYLSAEYIVRSPSLTEAIFHVEKLANEFAIMVAISPNASKCLIELALNHFSNTGISISFLNVFINRLIAEKPVLFISDELILSIFYLLFFGVTSDFIKALPIQISNQDIKLVVLKYYYISRHTSEEVHFRLEHQHGTYQLREVIKTRPDILRIE